MLAAAHPRPDRSRRRRDAPEIMPENNKVDITPLIGRRFVAKSKNRVRVTRLEEGAVRYMWARLPSDSDMAEAEAWAAKGKI